MSKFEIREIEGKYYLYCADEEVLSPEGESISTTSEELANLLLKDAKEYGLDCENPLSILSYHALYCDFLQQEEDEDGSNIDIDKLRAKGKGVLLFIRAGSLDPVNAENNKDTDFLSDVYFYSPFGKEYDFILKNCYIRIQGTSSTKYPRKN